MARNIRQQLRHEVFAAFHEGRSKTEERREGTNTEKIFSYGSRNQLLDRINDFCKTLPADVKKLSQLTPKHVSDYLDSKARNCTQATINEYRSELKKIGQIIGVDLRCDKVLADKKNAPDRGSSSVISQEDWSKILDYTKEHPSATGTCLQLEALIGVRVSDLAYGVRVKDDELVIRSKNGKYCYRAITSEIRALMNTKEFKSLLVKDKLIAPKDNSINTYLRRVQDKLGLERHSFHDIRRRIAQDKYNEYRTTGLSRTEALQAVSKWLNHGPNREKMVLASYISDAW